VAAPEEGTLRLAGPVKKVTGINIGKWLLTVMPAHQLQKALVLSEWDALPSV
jgi:hypothetical protein